MQTNSQQMQQMASQQLQQMGSQQLQQMGSMHLQHMGSSQLRPLGSSQLQSSGSGVPQVKALAFGDQKFSLQSTMLVSEDVDKLFPPLRALEIVPKLCLRMLKLCLSMLKLSKVFYLAIACNLADQSVPCLISSDNDNLY